MNRILFSLVVTGVLGLYCVSANAASFVAGTGTQAGTVTDNTTNLMWQQCSAGLVSSATCTSNPTPAITYNWEAAITYCEGLPLGGFTDWRLPNVKELKSIANMTTANPAINTTYFPATGAFYYWSSTSYAPSTTVAWLVDFDNGFANNVNKTDTNYVRCVRGQ